MKNIAWKFLLATVFAGIGSMVAISKATAVVAYDDWYGSGVLTSIDSATCPNGSFDQSPNKVFFARFLPANVGSNGGNTALSFLNQRWAQSFVIAGTFTSTFQTVNSVTVARFGGPSGYTTQLKITKQTPAVVKASTPMVTLQGSITGFSGFPSNDNCAVNFSATLFRP